MTKKRLDTTLHYAQYVGARIVFVVVIGVLFYSLWVQNISAIIFCSLFLVNMVFVLRKVFDKPTEIEFDDNFIYLENGKRQIEFEKVIGVKRRRIVYEFDGVEGNIKLPHFHFMDKKWMELNGLIKSKKH